MLLESLVVASIASLQLENPPHYQEAMAAAVMSQGERRYESPTHVEVPAPSGPPPTAEALPAPAPNPISNQYQRTLGPPQPDPNVRLPGQQIAQAPSNADILKRLEALEEENRRLRAAQPQQPAPSTQSQPVSAPPAAGAPVAQKLPAQMIPGWKVSLHEWNAEGAILTDPMKVFIIRSGRFSAMLGQEAAEPFDYNRRVNRGRRGQTNQMFIYKLDGYLNVTRAGTYTLGYEVNCPTFHGCNLYASIGGQQVMRHRDKNFENSVLFQSRQLAPGAYRMEVVFNIAKNKFHRFDPGAVKLYPIIRGPDEPNFRNFGPEELMTESNPAIPTGLPRY